MMHKAYCPFCGGEAKLNPSYDVPFVYCRKCGAESDIYDTKAEAIAAWNTRAERECEFRKVGSENYPGDTHMDTAYQCSECGYITLGRPSYCPDCGAKVKEARQ